MASLRQLLKGSVLSLALAGSASAQESDTGVDRSEFTAPQARKEVLDRAVHVNYDNWQREVVNYDGAVIVLFSSSCPPEEEGVVINRNMDVVYLGLIDKFENTKVKDLPLKFEFYDVCGKSKAEIFGVFDRLQTHMYLEGKLVDTRVGGPTEGDKLDGNVRAMSDWIGSNVLNTPITYEGENKKVVFNREFKPKLIPYEQ